MSQNLDTEIAALQQAVAQQKSVNESAEALIQGFTARLAAATQSASNAGATAEQLAALNTLHDDLTSNTNGLSSSVAANTPAATDSSAPPVSTDAPSTASTDAGPSDAPVNTSAS